MTEQPRDPAAAPCSTCALLQATADQSTCSIRSVAIERPGATFCASHTAYGRLRRPFPIGPVFTQGEAGVPVPVCQALDTPEVRDRLLEQIADLHPHHQQPLSFRQAVVVWQLRQLDERRAYVHLDRIDATRERHARGVGGKGLLGPLALLDPLLDQHAPATSADPAEFLTRFSLAGRLLLLSSLLIGCGVFVALLLLEIELWQGMGNTLGKLHLGLLGGVSAVAAAIWLHLGLRVLRRMNIEFRAVVKPTDA